MTEVVMSCQHAVSFDIAPPARGDSIWCVRCREYRRVSMTAPTYSLRCRDCRYGARFGSARVLAETKGAKHATRKMHTVDLRDGKDVIYTWHRTQQPTLDDVPPF